MSVAGSQQQTFLRLLGALRPHWHRDVALPARIQTLLARHKEFGSRDRRLYRELIYTTLRYLPWIEPLLDREPARAAKMVAWLAAETRATAAYRRETTGDWPAAATLRERAAFLAADPTALLPGWFRAECPSVFESPELDAQLARAPLWLRLQTNDPPRVAEEFSAKAWPWRPAAALESAWQLLADADVTKSEAFARGAIEVQDLGSQFVLESIGVEPGGRWLDACAGAGGKTLQLARLLGARGAIDAFDIRAAALDELAARIKRATSAPPEPLSAPSSPSSRPPQPKPHPSESLRPEPPPSESPHPPLPDDAAQRTRQLIVDVQPTAIRIRRERPAAEELYDGVLVDAPCSGSGTWRRAPHLKWTTTANHVERAAEKQCALLDQFSRHVRPGGRLVYATCSLARTENEAVVAAFLAAHPEFEPAAFARTFGFEPRDGTLTILPARHDTDGFFVATLRRR